jgi:hypothetical protein
MSKVRVVADGTLSHLRESRLHALPATRPKRRLPRLSPAAPASDRRHLGRELPREPRHRAAGCPGGRLARRHSPHINLQSHGIEDIHYLLSLDAVFADRMYGPQRAERPPGGRGLPREARGDAHPPAAGAPFVGGLPSAINFNSWLLVHTPHQCHGELSAWRRDDTGAPFSRHFVGRGDPPANWVNPLSEETNAYFPFHPLNPDSRERNMRVGDYV